MMYGLKLALMMMFRLSGVMPIHNEEEYLPYCLASLQDAPLHELIVLIDSCNDRSEEIIRKFNSSFPVKVAYAKGREWQNRISELTEQAFSLCEGEIIFPLFADVIYDKRIFDTKPFEHYDMISFRGIDRDLYTPLWRTTYETFLSSMFEKIDFKEVVWRGCIFGTKREVWKKLGFKDVASNFGEHLQFRDYRDRLVNAGYKYLYVRNRENIHLRTTTFTKETQIQEGCLRANKHYPFWRVALHSLIHLKPHVFTGYVRGKN